MPTSSSKIKSPRVAMTLGDPAGVGPEVALKLMALTQKTMGRASGVFIGDAAWLKRLAQRLKIRWVWPVIHSPKAMRPGWQIWDAVKVPGNLSFGKIQTAAGRAALQSLDLGIELARTHQVDALVTAPVSKSAISRVVGASWIGHTEYLAAAVRNRTMAFGPLAAACGKNVEPIMMFYAEPFSVALVTTHLSLSAALRQLGPRRVERILLRTREVFQRDFGKKNVRIAVAGINPHAGEDGLLGTEEKKWLAPLVRRLARQAKRTGASVTGPWPPDSVFLRAAAGEFDVVVAMTHDQGLIPIKLMAWDRAVHVTLGLPFVRTSPTHGTAFDRAGKFSADPKPMLHALRLAMTMVRPHHRKLHA